MISNLIFLAQALTMAQNISPSSNQTNPPIAYNAQFRQCVIGAANQAINEGADRVKAMAAIEGVVGVNSEIIALSRVQPEHRLEIWDYLAPIVDDERIADGQEAFMRYEVFLRDLGVRTGVDPSVVVALWGVETNYGRIMGRKKVIDALATLGCSNRPRAQFFKSELVAAIKIQAAGHVSPENFIGSWAGAFGQTQFMPTTFLRLAVDGDNDGKKQIIENPLDALASTANYLVRSGYVRGEKWGYEVSIPSNYRGPRGRTNTQAMNIWSNSGFKQANGAELPNLTSRFGLISPAGANGPSFLVGRNFNAVYAYNPALSYALAVNLLSDRIKGGPVLTTSWPTTDEPISRAKRREIQNILISLGYDIGEADGIIGQKSKDALKDLFQMNGLVFDGSIATNTLNKVRQFRPRQ